MFLATLKPTIMRQLLALLFAITGTIGFGQKTNVDLFKILEDDKAGYINDKGQVVIQPIFRTAGEFSEGLAAVRINGTYGYIDPTGSFSIQPQFDYATHFREGLAIVVNDGQPFYINKQGQKPFEISFPVIGHFKNGIARIQTSTEKTGFIDKHGKLIIDTIFRRINPFIQGMAVVEGVGHHPYKDREKGINKKYEMGVIDTLGQFIIPYGSYQEVHNFENGYFRVEIPAEPWDTIEGYSKKTGFIDKSGKLIFAREHKNNSWIDGNIHCGLAKMNLYKYWIKEEGISYSTANSYEGFINLDGEIVINDTTYEFVKDFSDNRTFIQDEDRNYFIIDTQGKIISNEIFSDVVGEGFSNGVAFVEKDRKYGMIDTNANFLIKPHFDGIHRVGVIDEYFFFYEWNEGSRSNNDRLYGIGYKDGSILLNAMMDDFDRGGFRNGLLRCVVNKKMTYVNKDGEIIWQEPESKSEQLANLNIDFMNRGYFYAYSKPNKKAYSGGWAESSNTPKRITSKDNFPENKVSVVVRQEMKDTIYGDCNGIKVFVANQSIKEIDFNAQDSRLYMKVQAQNSKGEWKDIEYLPSSWCGNSYHTVTLGKNEFWSFLTPVYEGDFKTKLRIELKYIDPSDESGNRWDKKEITIYSNEYEASINPGQFWRKQSYSPNGIMDPYND